MIVPMKLDTLLCLERDRAAAVDALAGLELMQLCKTALPSTQDVAALSAQLNDCERVLGIVRSAPAVKNAPAAPEVSDDDLVSYASGLISGKAADLKEQERLQHDVNLLAPWGEFDRAAIANLQAKGVYVTLCATPRNLFDQRKKDDAFPWMEFDRLLSDEAVYGLNGRREVVSVSVAQHNETKLFSETAWYGGNDRSRSWHDGKNDTRKDSWLYGFNLEEQFEWALSVDPEIIFITGWNEWLAQRQPPRVNAITFVDNANINCSRDIEPMEGGYGDNYYMQMISLIRRFKGIPETPQRTYRTIDVNDGFSQWNDVGNVYRDYENDTVPRNSFAYDMMILEDGSGRNDIVEMKVCEDAGSVYFFARTREPLTEPSDGKWMNLFIATYGSGALGYDLVVNYRPPEDGKAYAARIPGPGSNALIPAGTCEMRYLGDMIQVKVPKSMIGALNGAKIWFKWTDNCSWQEDGADAFYTTGDAAPIGRAGYAYGYDF